eukprot:3940661-Rhodomonas_salina.7
MRPLRPETRQIRRLLENPSEKTRVRNPSEKTRVRNPSGKTRVRNPSGKTGARNKQTRRGKRKEKERRGRAKERGDLAGLFDREVPGRRRRSVPGIAYRSTRNDVGAYQYSAIAISLEFRAWRA